MDLPIHPLTESHDSGAITVTARVLIVEDHELLAQSVAFALRADGIEVDTMHEADPEQVLAGVHLFHPTVALLDLHLNDATSIPLIAPISARGTAVIMVTGEVDRMRLAECLEAGAIGIVSKSDPFDRLVEAVKRAAAGEELMSSAQRHELLAELWRRREEREIEQAPFTRLTPREQEVLAALMDGKTAETIATESFVSLSTVRSQIRAVLMKLGVNSQLAAVSMTRRAGWQLTA